MKSTAFVIVKIDHAAQSEGGGKGDEHGGQEIDRIAVSPRCLLVQNLRTRPEYARHTRARTQSPHMTLTRGNYVPTYPASVLNSRRTWTWLRLRPSYQ